MTLVGDFGQASRHGSASGWDEVQSHIPTHAPVRHVTLTVNYRTPAEIMEVAADVLAAVAPELRPPRSVREAGSAPWRLRLDGAGLPEVIAAEAATVGDGTLAVLVPAARLEELGRLLTAALPAAAAGQGPSVLDAPIAVLPVAEAKGLEFDAVVVVDPAAILAASVRGPSDLYVALTRATARLGVVHSGDLPPVLARLRPVSLPEAVRRPR
jgi:superfamily I DNA/RNA helicase